MSPRRSGRTVPRSRGTVSRRPDGMPRPAAEQLLGSADASLLDIVDNVLNKGVVLTGDITIALAQVDLIYARLSLLLCAADRVLPDADRESSTRRPRRAAGRLALKPTA